MLTLFGTFIWKDESEGCWEVDLAILTIQFNIITKYKILIYYQHIFHIFHLINIPPHNLPHLTSCCPRSRYSWLICNYGIFVLVLGFILLGSCFIGILDPLFFATCAQKPSGFCSISIFIVTFGSVLR